MQRERKHVPLTQARLYGTSTRVQCLAILSDALLADKVVKVPEMAESISEGTLKQWSKRRFTKVSISRATAF